MTNDKRRFTAKYRGNPAFAEDIAAASSIADAIAIAKANGFDIDAAAVRDVCEPRLPDEGELTDDQLDEAFGGFIANPEMQGY